MTTLSRTVRVLSAVLALALIAAACSSDGSESATADDASTDTEASDNAEVETETTTTTTTTVAPTTTTVALFPPPVFEPGDCEFDPPVDADIEVSCGWVEVPQHWDDATDPDVIRLHVATFTSSETPADAEPVVYLEGGPGGSTLELVSFTFAEQFGAFLPQNPVVLFTQRGSAGSEVDLECEELVDFSLDSFGELVDDETFTAQANDIFGQCIERLEGEGADLSAYHTAASANDVDAIRQALGYDQWNLLGVSYGTRLGQEVARIHPDGIRALLLDSVQPTDPALGSLAAVPGTFERSLDQLFEGCAANAECAAANPNLEERLRTVVAAAAARPFEMQAADQISAESYDVVVDDSRLLSAIFQAMYSPEAFAAIPEMVTQLEAGDTSTLAALMGLQVTNAPFISNGMYNAVMCHDFLAELTPDEAFDAGQTGDPLFDEAFAGNLAEDAGTTCDLVGSGSAPASIIEPVESSVPTLIMSGEYDPITPPSFADAIAPGFSDRNVVVLPHAGHGAAFTDCGQEIALGFFANPDPAGTDTSCIETSAEPNWVPGSLEGTEFEPFEDAFLAIRSVAPAGWEDQGFGTFVRPDTNLAHQVLLIQQGAPLPAEQLLSLFASQLGGEAIPGGTVDDSTGRTWAVSNLDLAISPARLYSHEADGFTLVVGAFAQAGTLEDMEAHVIPTILDSIEPL